MHHTHSWPEESSVDPPLIFPLLRIVSLLAITPFLLLKIDLRAIQNVLDHSRSGFCMFGPQLFCVMGLLSGIADPHPLFPECPTHTCHL